MASATDEVTEALVRQTVCQVRHGVIAQQTKQMTQRLALPELAILQSFKGVGHYTTIGLLLQIESAARFASAKQLAAYFGLHPVYKAAMASARCV